MISPTATTSTKTTAKRMALIGASCMVVLAISLGAWFGSVFWQARHAVQFLSSFEKIHETKPPLTVSQVEQLMGPPIRIEHSESTDVTADVYHYPTYPVGGDFRVIFVNGVVFNTAVDAPKKS